MKSFVAATFCSVFLAGCGGSQSEGEAEAEAEAESESESEGECAWTVTSSDKCEGARETTEPNLECLGNNPPPAVSGESITVQGHLLNALGGQGVEGATIQAFDAQGGSAGDAVTTCEGGSYELVQPVAQDGFAGWLHIEVPKFWDTDLYMLSRPRTTDLACFEVPIVSNDAAKAQEALLGFTSDPDKGLVAIIVWDCDEKFVSGATVDLNVAYEARVYISGDTGLPQADLTATSSKGTVVFLNTDPGNATATATRDGTTLGTTDLVVTAGTTMSAAAIEPE